MILWMPIALAWCVCSSLSAKVSLNMAYYLSTKLNPLNIMLEIEKTVKYVQGRINIGVQVFDIAPLDFYIRMHFLGKTIHWKFIPVPFTVTRWLLHNKEVKVDTSRFNKKLLKSVRVCSRKDLSKAAVLEIELMNMKSGAGGPYYYLVTTSDYDYKMANVSKYNVKEGTKLTFHQILDLIDDVTHTFNDALILNIGNREAYRTLTKTCTVRARYNFPTFGYEEYEHTISPGSFVTTVVKNGLDPVKCGTIPDNTALADVYWSLGSPIIFRIKHPNGYLYYARYGDTWTPIIFTLPHKGDYARALTSALDYANSYRNNLVIDISKERHSPGKQTYRSGSKDIVFIYTSGGWAKGPPSGFHRVTHTLPGNKFSVVHFVDGNKDVAVCSKYNGFADLDRVEVLYSELRSPHIPMLVCMYSHKSPNRRCISLVGNGIWADCTLGDSLVKGQLEALYWNINKKVTIDISQKAQYGKGPASMTVRATDSRPFKVYLHECMIPSLVSKIVSNGQELSGIGTIDDYVVRARVYYFENNPRFIFLHSFKELLFCSRDNLGKWAVDKRITNFSHSNVAAVERDNASYFNPANLKNSHSESAKNSSTTREMEREDSESEDHDEDDNSDQLVEDTSQEEEPLEEEEKVPEHGPTEAPSSGHRSPIINDSARATESHAGPKLERVLRQESTTDVVPKSHTSQPSHGSTHSTDILKYAKPRTTIRDHPAPNRDHPTLNSRDYSTTTSRDHSITTSRDHSITTSRDHSITTSRDHLTLSSSSLSHSEEPGSDHISEVDPETEPGAVPEAAEELAQGEIEEAETDGDPDKRQVQELFGFAGFSIFDLFSFSGGFSHGIWGVLVSHSALYALIYL